MVENDETPEREDRHAEEEQFEEELVDLAEKALRVGDSWHVHKRRRGNEVGEDIAVRWQKGPTELEREHPELYGFLRRVEARLEVGGCGMFLWALLAGQIVGALIEWEYLELPPTIDFDRYHSVILSLTLAAIVSIVPKIVKRSRLRRLRGELRDHAARAGFDVDSLLAAMRRDGSFEELESEVARSGDFDRI